VCDHDSGIEARMLKSLQLQAEIMEEFGVCVFDVTLDCEDGVPVRGEKYQANRVLALANPAQAATIFIAKGGSRRVGVRGHSISQNIHGCNL
jgi:citrate lyase subunit beta/citryl-CoA lyase